MPAIDAFVIGVDPLEGGASSSAPVPAGYQQLPLLPASRLSVPAGATLATFVAEGGVVRYRDDGQEATATAGMPLAAGTSLHYFGNLSSLHFAAQSPGAILNVLYYAPVSSA